MHRALAAAIALATLAACAPRAVIPDAERQRVFTEFTGQQRWLRASVYVAPLWGDGSKALLTDAFPGELDLVESAGGVPVPPPATERILGPGTPVRIREVEFPTGWTIANRVVMSPRYHPWVLLDVPGDMRPNVLVLSQTAASFDDVRAEMERILSSDDPSSLFAALPPEHREAILKKELVEGMSLRAVEMSWGMPERKRIDRPTHHEEWFWPGGKRKAIFQDDRLTRWEK